MNKTRNITGIIDNQSSSIRVAHLDDAAAIAQVHICSRQKMYQEFIPESILESFSVDEFTLQWRNLITQNVRVLVIEVEKKIVGFVSVCPFRYEHAEPKSGEISAMYIDPNYWRQGLGAKVCLAALTDLKQQGFDKVFLWVLVGNSQAREFYEALGFHATEITKLEELYEGGALLTDILYQREI